MKIPIAVLTVGLLALPVYAQGEQSRVAQLEAQLARYREATDKLVGTLTRTNDELNEKVKELSKSEGELTIQVAELQVKLDQAHRVAVLQDRAQGRRQVRPIGSPTPKVGLIYRSEFQAAVESLAEAVAAMQQADSVPEGLKLLDGATKDIATARKALEMKRE